jgi:hypothetical protein
MVAMFISSKYEDLSPLLMKTIINKIGHGKFTLSGVLERELKMLRTIEFRIGSPTILEFIETYKTELMYSHLSQLKS